MSLHHDLFLMRMGLDKIHVRPAASLATIEHHTAADHPRDLVREAIRDLLATVPRPGTLAADLTDDEKMALAVAAGAPHDVVFEGGRAHVRTTVPVGFADRGDGGYIVAIGREDREAPRILVQLARPESPKGEPS